MMATGGRRKNSCLRLGLSLRLNLIGFYGPEEPLFEKTWNGPTSKRSPPRGRNSNQQRLPVPSRPRTRSRRERPQFWQHRQRRGLGKFNHRREPAIDIRPSPGSTAALDQVGTRPSAPHDQRTASTYIFGPICANEGKGAGLVLPLCNCSRTSSRGLRAVVNQLAGRRRTMIRTIAIGIGAALCFAPLTANARRVTVSNQALVDIELRSALESRERKQGPGES